MGIESVVGKTSDKSSGGLHDAACTACEMAVVWMQNQIRRNQTEDQILNYVNEVNQLFLVSVYISLVITHILISLCSSVTDCLVQMDNQQLTVAVYLPCPVFHSRLAANRLTLPRSRYGVIQIL